MTNDEILSHFQNFLEVQSLLFEEAALLDNWQLDEWLALFTEDALYRVPPTDAEADASPETTLFYIADDRARLEQRVLRLNKKTAHSEHPRSKVRHLVSNIRILQDKNDLLTVEAAFAIYRSKDGVTDVFMGRYNYVLKRDGNQTLKIARKDCHLDMDGLRPHGRISIIL